MNSRAGTLIGAASTIAGVTLASRVVGFGRWLVFSREVGGTCAGQAYATANQLPNVLYEVTAGGALAAVVVPLVASAVERGDRERADRIASALLTWAVAVLLPLAVLVTLFAKPIASAMSGNATGRCSSMVDLTGAMLVVFAPQVLLYGVGIVLSGVLQAHRRFLAAALAPLLSSIVVIAAYLAYGALTNGHDESGDTARNVLAWGTTAGVVVLSLPLLIPVHRAGVRLRPRFDFPDGVAARARRLAGAGMVGLLAQQLAVLTTIGLANGRGDVGAVNVYNYVQAVYLLPYALLVTPIAMAAFPRLAGDDGQRVLARVLPLVGATGLLGAAALIAIAGPVGGFFRALDARPEAMHAMTPALAAYAPGLVGFSLVALLSRALYTRGHARTAGLAVAAGWLVAALAPFAGLIGVQADSTRTLVVLGACSSVGMTVAAAVLVVLVRRDWPDAELGAAVRSWVRAAIAALVAGAAGCGLGAALGGVTGSLGGAALAAGIVGAVVVAVFVGLLARLDGATVRAARSALQR